MRWNSLTASVEGDLLQSVAQNAKLLELRVKGNRFSENLFAKIKLHMQSTWDRTPGHMREKHAELKREVEQACLVADPAKSGGTE